MALGMLEGCRCSDSGVQVLGWFASFDAPWSKHCFAEACRGCTPQAGEVGVEQQAMFAIANRKKQASTCFAASHSRVCFTLRARSMPNFGTHAYVFLQQSSDRAEALPTYDPWLWLGQPPKQKGKGTNNRTCIVPEPSYLHGLPVCRCCFPVFAAIQRSMQTGPTARMLCVEQRH